MSAGEWAREHGVELVFGLVGCGGVVFSFAQDVSALFGQAPQTMLAWTVSAAGLGFLAGWLVRAATVSREAELRRVDDEIAERRGERERRWAAEDREREEAAARAELEAKAAREAEGRERRRRAEDERLASSVRAASILSKAALLRLHELGDEGLLHEQVYSQSVYVPSADYSPEEIGLADALEELAGLGLAYCETAPDGMLRWRETAAGRRLCDEMPWLLDEARHWRESLQERVHREAAEAEEPGAEEPGGGEGYGARY